MRQGQDEAAILMSYLPPTRWADVATKHDLAVLREQMVTKVEFVEEFAALRQEIRGEMHSEAIRIDSKFDKVRDDIRVWNLATMITVITVLLGQHFIH